MSLSSMRLALRLARRDARRAKGRSVLVVILLGLPVMAVAGAASLMDSFELSEAERVERQLGGADALMSWDYDVPVEQWPFDQYAYPVDYDAEVEEVEHTREDLEAVLPEGSRAIDVTLSQTQTPTEYGGQALDVWGLDLSDPIAEGVYPVLEGEAPGDGETALSQAAADKLGLGVGDEVELSDLDGGKFEISAIVEDPASLKGQFAVVPPEVAGGELDHWLVDTPEPLLWEDVRELNEVGVGALSQAVAENPPPESEYNASAGPASQEDMMIIGMGILLVAMVILQIVLLAGPAFAISAKRRTREFALLAVNGATPAQVRRTVLAGGVVLGVISTLVSLTAGFAIAAAATPLAENIVGQRAGDFSFFPAVTLPAALLA
ncbi:MAG: ABC transporter permease, partial [Stackebrandtia sp.]